jgi:hypothetical protein
MDGGRDEQEIGELYFAEANAPYVSRAVPILYPAARNTEDGNSLGPSPTFTTGDIARGTYGLKSYGFGFVSYKSDAAMDVTLRTALDRSGNSQTTTLAATTLNRKRMDLFKDSQAAWWEVEIDDPGEQTEIYYLEAETREYPPGSDSLGA